MIRRSRWMRWTETTQTWTTTSRTLTVRTPCSAGEPPSRRGALLRQRWRWDLNPRWSSPHTLSRNALLPTPSASSRYRSSSPEGSDWRLSVNCTQAEMQDICANDRRADFGKAMRGGWLKTSSTRFDDRALAQVTHLLAAGRFRWGEAPARPWSRRA